jgi:hypothetical protein
VPDGIPFWEDDPATQKDAGRAKARSIFVTARKDRGRLEAMLSGTQMRRDQRERRFGEPVRKFVS